MLGDNRLMNGECPHADTWGEEHMETYAPCPMCGCTCESEGRQDQSHNAAQVLKMIALMVEENPLGTDTVLLSVCQGWSYSEIGLRHGCTKQAVEDSLSRLEKKYPMVTELIRRK
jgi:hypothetical protein